jgi:hypothetical protein
MTFVHTADAVLPIEITENDGHVQIRCTAGHSDAGEPCSWTWRMVRDNITANGNAIDKAVQHALDRHSNAIVASRQAATNRRRPPATTTDGPFTLHRHPNYGTVGRVKITCDRHPGETYTADQPAAIQAAQDAHMSSAHPGEPWGPF